MSPCIKCQVTAERVTYLKILDVIHPTLENLESTQLRNVGSRSPFPGHLAFKNLVVTQH